MPVRKTRTPIALAASVATALVASLVLLSAASSAGAAGCGRIAVHVSKHRVKPGQFVRVSGGTCSNRDERPGFVRIKLRTKRGWQQVGISHTRRTGRFTRRVRVPAALPERTVDATTRLQVVASDSQSPSVPIELAGDDEAPAGPSGCPLSDPGYEVGPTIDGCRVLASDTASSPSPMSFWGRVDCGVWPNLDAQRATRPTGEGDPHPTATGAPQGNTSFRTTTVFDGDDVAGERCELGENDNEVGPTAFYREGDRRITYASLRLPDNFPLDSEKWQTVLQMKQAQPANNGGGVPILFLEAFDGTFFVDSDHGIHWEFPAEKNVWTRFMFDVTYSDDANQGSIQVAADLNEDGDFSDAGERSPRIETATLRTETAGPQTSVAPGAAIPSHLRAGIYHDSSYSCPPPTGCSTEIDNVQVVAP